jgi:outer membrane protein TolC
MLSCLGMVARGETQPLPTPVPEELFPELKTILQQALTQSPQVLLKSLEISQNEATYLIARSSMLPSLSFGASYGVNGAAIASNTDSSSTSSGLYYSASIGQPVFRWGTLKAQTEMAKIQVSISQKNYADAYARLAQTLRAQYLGLIIKKLALRNAKAAYDQVASALAVEEDKLRNGRVSESSVFNLRLQAEEMGIQAERAAEELAQGKRAFLRLAGQKELPDDRIPEEIPAVNFDQAATNTMLHQFLAGGAEDNLSVRMTRDWLKYYDLNYKVAKFRLYPMFSLGASIAQSNSTSTNGSTVSQASVLTQSAAISMSWSVFDGFATKGAKLSARTSQRYYERTLQVQTEQMMEQATQQEKQIGFAYRAMNLAKTRAGMSEAALRMTREDAQRGLASQAAVEAAVNVNYQSQLNLLNLRADFLSRWADFAATVGRDPVLQFLPPNLHVQAR